MIIGRNIDFIAGVLKEAVRNGKKAPCLLHQGWT
jgi:hypothetical protein